MQSVVDTQVAALPPWMVPLGDGAHAVPFHHWALVSKQ
jgi:hypothetical protein